MSKNRIKCLECDGKFKRITNTHLIKHNLTMAEYMLKYPGAEIDAPGLAYARVEHLRGKSYAEVYGVNKASEMISTRREDTTTQMSDALQIQLRKEKCGQHQRLENNQQKAS